MPEQRKELERDYFPRLPDRRKGEVCRSASSWQESIYSEWLCSLQTQTARHEPDGIGHRYNQNLSVDSRRKGTRRSVEAVNFSTKMLEEIYEAIALYAHINMHGCDVLLDRIEDVGDSFGQCYSTSQEFLEWFRRNYWAEDTAIVHCWGFRKPLGKDSVYMERCYKEDEWGQKQYRNTLYHVVFRIGPYYIDLTGAQFGEQYGGVMFYFEEELLEVWWSATEEASESVPADQSLAYA